MVDLHHHTKSETKANEPFFFLTNLNLVPFISLQHKQHQYITSEKKIMRQPQNMHQEMHLRTFQQSAPPFSSSSQNHTYPILLPSHNFFTSIDNKKYSQYNHTTFKKMNNTLAKKKRNGGKGIFYISTWHFLSYRKL